MPRIIYANIALAATGGHSYYKHDTVIQVDGVDNLRSAVRKENTKGSKWIKIMNSSRVELSEYTQAELDAIVDEAHRNKLKVSTHSTNWPALQGVINAGVDTIEHGSDLTEEQVKQMIEKGIALVPTLYSQLSIYLGVKNKADAKGFDALSPKEQETYKLYKKSVENQKKNFKTFADMGVTIVTGTDIGAHTEVGVPGEIRTMVEYGLEPLKAIAAATSNCAAVLGEDGIGELAPGKVADILVVKGNALEDIRALTHPEAVFFGGEKVKLSTPSNFVPETHNIPEFHK